MLCQTKYELLAKSWDAWKDCETAEAGLDLAAKDKTAHPSALVRYRLARKVYHDSVAVLREHRNQHNC